MVSTVRQRAIQKARHILQQNPLYLDTETTGLGPTDEIIEIALMDDNEQILFQSFVRPSQSIPPSTTAIHGITNAMVQNAPPWPILWQQIRGIMQNRLIAIYNADFDIRMMRQSMTRYRQSWNETISTECIMRLYAAYRGEWDNQRMSYRFISLIKPENNAESLCPMLIGQSQI